MPFKVSVGPPVLAINQGNTFMVSDLDGQISEHSEGGIYTNDTRFISYYKIYSNDKEWTKLSSSLIDYSSARIYLVNQAFLTEKDEVPAESLAMTISRNVRHGICETIEIVNYAKKKVRFNLEIALRADFADLFEVRWRKFYRRGRIETTWDAEHQCMHISYENGDFKRSVTYEIQDCVSPTHFANGRLIFEMELAPGQSWVSKGHFHLNCSAEADLADCEQHKQNFDDLQKRWIEEATSLTCSNEEIYRLFRQSVEDTGALRFYDEKFGADMWIPAAGVPWYVTIFGRDSLIVSLQTIYINPKLALGTLKELSLLQADKLDDWRDAQPGKIAHELRFGELAHLDRVPNPNYGTADATPLFIIVLHETYMWTGDLKILQDYRDVVLKCLNWIDQYGDLDGDGYQEYQTRSEGGFENMGWKDSPDCIVYPDGSNVPQPKAICELQGYVFDAWMRAAEIFDALGEQDQSRQLRRKARDLRTRFEKDFWLEDEDFYALTLDPDKKAVATLASNAGHLLFSGICSQEHADRMIARFFKDDFWSGWGIRTLPVGHPSYNPHSYHNGSVWPHDNGIIAAGCKRYGHAEQVGKIARDISRAAMYFTSNRLPELYAGVARSEGSFPVQYSQANVPQAWAAGSAFHLISSITGLRADAPAGKLYVDPALPRWLPDLALSAVRVGQSLVNLKFKREEDGTSTWSAEVTSGKLTVEQKSWSPWSIENDDQD